MSSIELDKLIAEGKFERCVEKDHGQHGQGLKDNLIDLANSYDKSHMWQLALWIHQRVDEIFPDDFANKIAVVNYLPHARTTKNANYLMQSIAQSYITIIKQLSQKTSMDNSLERYKLTMDMMGNIASLIINNQTEDFSNYTKACNAKKWYDLVFYTDITFEDIKQCFAVGDAVLEAFPENEELEAYVYHIWGYFYPMYEVICKAKTDNKGKKYWYTKINVDILEDKLWAINEYNKRVNGTLGERIAAFFKAKFLGKGVYANETPWQKYYREKSERDYKQLQTCRRSFTTWTAFLKGMLKTMSKTRGTNESNRDLFYINTKRDAVGCILYDDDDPRCFYASDWTLINNPLYYWLSGNVYYNGPKKSQKSTEVAQAQPTAKNTSVYKNTGIAAVATASYTAYQNYATKPQEETLYYTYTDNNSANNNFNDDDEWEHSRTSHDKIEDERGYMINGKWAAEHERNMSNPGSPFDSNGYAKSPAYEEAIRDNFYLEEEEGYHGYDNPDDYAVDDDSSYNDANDDE